MEDYIYKKLLDIFPDKNLIEFNKKIQPLRAELTKMKPKDLKLKEYVKTLGFEENKKARLDKNIIIMLEEQFKALSNYERKIFEECLKVSKQRVEQLLKLSLKSKDTENWEVEKFTEYEINLIDEMIFKQEHKIEKTNYTIYILFNGKMCIVLSFDKTKKQFYSIINQNSEIIIKLKKEGFHKFFIEDFKNIKYCKKILKDDGVQVLSDELEKSPNKNSKSIERYINFLGFSYVSPNKLYTDEEIKIMLSQYIYPGTQNKVYLPTDLKTADLFRRLASRNNKQIGEFIEDYGFEYCMRDALLRVERILKEISFSSNKVWIPSKSSLYSTIFQMARRKKLKLDELVKYLGFEKTRNKPESISMSNIEYSKYLEELYCSYKVERMQKKNINRDLEKEIEEIKKIEENLDFLTEKEVIIKQRIGQSSFRKALINNDCTCKICGLSGSHFLIASHIKPWSLSTNIEKLDPNNGFLLCPNHDFLFDKGYISFTSEGKIIISNKIDKDILKKFNISEKIKIDISFENINYLSFHKEKIFDKF